MSSSCSTCSPTLGMVHQYHLSQSFRFIVVSTCIFVWLLMLIIFLCTYWPFNISCFCSYCVVFFFNEWSEFFSSFSKFLFLLPSPFYASEAFSFSHWDWLCLCLISVFPTQSHPLFPPLSLLFLHSCSPFPSKTPQNPTLWPPLLFHTRKNSITGPPISVLAWYHVPNRRKYSLSRKA